MNNAKLWLVVKPTVGIPLFLSAVAVGSFAVHVAVLSKVTWYNDYLTGQPLGTGALVTSQAMPQQDAAKVSYLASGSQEVLVTMPDGSTARAVLELPEKLAMN